MNWNLRKEVTKIKKIIALILALVCALGLVACSNAEPETIHKTCTGIITSIDLNLGVLAILDETTNEEIAFGIASLMSNSQGANPYLETLSIGDKVTVEAEYVVNCKTPYPAVNVSKAVE